MGDFIDRQALLEQLREICDRCVESSNTYGDKDPLDEDELEIIANDYNDVIRIVEKMPSAGSADDSFDRATLDFCRVADRLKAELGKMIRDMARKVPEDGSRPGVNYRRSHARSAFFTAKANIEALKWSLSNAIEAQVSARPVENADE